MSSFRSSFFVRLAIFLFLIGVLVPAHAIPVQAVPVESVHDRSVALSTLFKEIWEDQLKHQPEFASSIGDRRYNDQLSDLSPRAFNDQLSRNRGFLTRLAAIDTAGLSDQEKLSVTLMVNSLIQQEEGARFKEWEMPVSQFGGIHTDLPSLVDIIPFDTVKDYDDYIVRLGKMQIQIRQTIENMMLGIDERRVQPAYLLEKVLGQVDSIASQKAADSPFAQPLKKFPKTISAADQKRISETTLAAIEDDVLPAYVRFGKFLKAQAIPAGRKELRVSSLPDGDKYYAYLVRENTTLTKTPAEIHQIGLDEVGRDEAEMLVIVKKLGFADMKSFSAALKANPKMHPASADALLDLYRHNEDQMRPRLPELFGRLPKAPLVVVPTPPYMASGSSAAFYQPGTPDGSRPGRVNVNTYEFANRSLAPVEAVAYHEGLPGHHLQLAISQELTGLPDFRRYTSYTAFVEGWGLYAERLGKEIGFYQDPYSDYGRLESDIWRAIRLVVDTGVHSQHWTRQQMVDFFHDHSAIDETNVQAEVDRYVAIPGQALGYKMGQLKILELRARAKAALGDKFDLKAFHDQIVDSGALPLDVLDQRINVWIKTQTKQ